MSSNTLKNDTSNRQLRQFFLLTFLFSWLLWLPGLLITHKFVSPNQTLTSISNILKWLAGIGPSSAAIFLVIRYDGKIGLKELFNRVLNVKLGYWYLPIFLILPLALVAAHFLNVFLFGASFPTSSLLTEFWWIPVVFLIFCVMQFAEELGWRGYAIDRLQKRWNAVLSSVLLGVFWAIWHLPMFFISGFGQYDNHIPYGHFFITIVLMSVIITWIQNNTRGSLVPAFILHALINLSSEILPLVEMKNDIAVDLTAWTICNLLLLLFATMVVFIWGYKKLLRY